MYVRRVVTKNGPQGKGVVVSDGPAPRTHDFVTIRQMSSTLVWSSEPDDGLRSVDDTAQVDTFVPPPGSTRFIILQIPPDGTIEPTTDPLDIVRENLFVSPGVADTFEPDGSGMHATPTVDYIIVLRGQLDLDLDDGTLVTLNAGDTVIQVGARHAWRNHTAEPAVAAIIMHGARTEG